MLWGFFVTGSARQDKVATPDEIQADPQLSLSVQVPSGTVVTILRVK
jgi:hypothetical protein